LKRLVLAVLVSGAALVVPATAMADPAICHDGILSDDAGQNCADGLYNQVYGHASNWTICHDGILSDDVGQGCTNDAGYAVASPAVHYNIASTGPSYSSNGYCGAYQFDQSTWSSVGMSGSACGASPAQQDIAAQRLYAQRGSEPWPHCGYLIPNWAALRQCENSGSYAP
jgi:hypothetical protein